MGVDFATETEDICRDSTSQINQSSEDAKQEKDVLPFKMSSTTRCCPPSQANDSKDFLWSRSSVFPGQESYTSSKSLNILVNDIRGKCTDSQEVCHSSNKNININATNNDARKLHLDLTQVILQRVSSFPLVNDSQNISRSESVPFLVHNRNEFEEIA
jgi:hypothetical protein